MCYKICKFDLGYTESTSLMNKDHGVSTTWHLLTRLDIQLGQRLWHHGMEIPCMQLHLETVVALHLTVYIR